MQAGQTCLLQVTVSERSSKKYCLRFWSNWKISRRILICSLGNSSQIFGKFYKGKVSSLIKFEWIGWRRLALHNWISLSPMLRTLFLIQVSWKEIGRKFWENRCINWIFEYEIRSGSGRIWSFLNKGSMWAL